MMRVYRRSGRTRSRRRGRLLSSLALVLIGSGGFYVAFNWFRHDAEDSAVKAETTVAAEAEADVPADQPTVPTLKKVVPALKVTEDATPLISVFDGQHTGRVQRFSNDGSAEFALLAYLPALDLKAEGYHVWLLKDGLADVKDMGELNPRADGSWVLSFRAGPETGIAEPKDYSSLVIMRELNDGNPAPSGNRIAEAKF